MLGITLRDRTLARVIHEECFSVLSPAAHDVLGTRCTESSRGRFQLHLRPCTSEYGEKGLQACRGHVALTVQGERTPKVQCDAALILGYTKCVLTTGVNSWELRVLAHPKIGDGLVNEAVTHKVGTFLEGPCRFDEACLAHRRQHRCSRMVQVSRGSSLSE